MKSFKTTMMMRCRMQRALNGKVYAENLNGVEYEEVERLSEIFPSAFFRIAKEKSVYDIQITVKRLT